METDILRNCAEGVLLGLQLVGELVKPIEGECHKGLKAANLADKLRVLTDTLFLKGVEALGELGVKRLVQFLEMDLVNI